MDEAELENRQDAKLYPVGRVLRATYDADNHDTLGRDVTGLMLDLSRVSTETAAPTPVAPQRRGWLDRMRALIHRR